MQTYNLNQNLFKKILAELQITEKPFQEKCKKILDTSQLANQQNQDGFHQACFRHNLNNIVNKKIRASNSLSHTIKIT